MRDVKFLGDSLQRIKDFPTEMTREVGYQIDRVQNDKEPNDWKPMKTVGKGVKEIRVKDSDNCYRVLYVVRVEDLVHILHAFTKKTEKTSKHDIDIAKQRLKEVTR